MSLVTTGRYSSPAYAMPLTFSWSVKEKILPPQSTFDRDSAATYWDENGDLVSALADEPRFEYESGTLKGLLIEPSLTNKCENYNANPTDTTGMSITGTGATLTVVDDATELANAGLDGVCTSGKVFKIDNSGGAGTALVDINGSAGNTNAHSVSVYLRSDGGGQVRASGSGTFTSFGSTASYTRIATEDFVPSFTGVIMRISAFAGVTVYFVLNQFEESTFMTSPIVTAGAAATREADNFYIPNLGNYIWFDQTQGAIGVSFIAKNKLSTADNYLFAAHDGTSANTIGMRIGTDNEVRAWVRAASTNKHTNTNKDEVGIGYLHSAGITWESGETNLFSSGIVNTQSYSGDPSGLTTLNIGSRNGAGEPLFGYIQGFVVSARKLSFAALGAYLTNRFEKVILGSGQSNMVGYFNSVDTGSGAGRHKFLEVFGTEEPSLDIHWAEGATGGAALLEESTTDPTNYFIDDSTGLYDGNAYAELVTAMDGIGNRGDLLIWDQGEQDASALNLGVTKSQYKTRLLELFSNIRSKIGAVPVLIIPLGRRTSFTNTGGYQTLREVQQELATENSWIHLGPEKFDQDLLGDGVHLTDAATVTMGERVARKALDVLGYSQDGVDGPSVTGASRMGTSVTVTLSHDNGTDFTPTSGIEGFTLYVERFATV